MSARRLVAVAAFLAVAALLSSSHLWGEPGKDKELNAWRQGGKNQKAVTNLKGDFAPELDRNRFTDQPIITYHDGSQTFFALQVQPRLPDVSALPVDYLVLIDTSASKAMGPLEAAKGIAEALSRGVTPADRIAIWTANLKPRDVSRGFKAGKDLEDALKELAKEVPLGAVNLKKCLGEALDSFEVKSSRRRVLLYMGDGKSVAEPVDADGRAALCETMIKKQVGFYAVPMGNRLDSLNLHGMVTGTGGKIVRLPLRDTDLDLIKRQKESGKKLLTGPEILVEDLQKVVREPVLYHAELKLPAGATEVLPSRLPPLRRDAPTLVIGKLAGSAKAIDARLSGESCGKAFRADISHKVPLSLDEHFFLSGVHGQWKGRKDQPALLPADRALASSHKQNQVAVESLLAKAELSLEANKLDIAEKLFEQAKQLDASSIRARGGLVLVEKMRTGKKSRKDMLRELRMDATRREVIRLDGGKRKIVVLDDGDEKKDDDGPGPRERNLQDEVRQRKKIAAQQANLTVSEAIRQANRLVRVSPDDAYRVLEQVRDDIKGNTDLDADIIRNLEARLARTMQSVNRLGATIKRDQAEALALRAAADARLDLRRSEQLAQDRVRERLRVFRNLMDQAREEEAFRQALALRDDLINQGRPVPTAVTAGYQIALSGYHLREEQELKRLREERFLATLLEVERSHIPFPDEPPVEFPSDAVVRRMTRGQFRNWRDFSKYRIARYSVGEFGIDVPGRMFELQRALNKTVDYAGTDDPKTTLGEALEQLAKVHRVTFDINERAFKYEMLNDPIKAEVANPNAIPAMKTTLATVLKKILARIPVPSGATYVIRRDVIEITTGQFATAEKAIRVYPVADLVTPIPNAFNQQAVQQTGSILGSLGQLGLAGGGAGGLNLGLALGGALGGGLGALGALGGGLGALGALGGGLGALGGGLGALGALGGGLGALGGGLGALGGGLGAVGGALGAAGGAALGAAGGPAGLQIGGQFQGGQNNLGVGGGFQGFTGGQLGQLGNLGGQFGLQGGTTQNLLITLIRQVVGRPKDWAVQYNPVTGQPINPLDDEKTEGGGLNQDNNNLGYYPPALALVVKAPSLMHTRDSSVIITGAGAGAGGAGGMVAAPREGGGGVLIQGNRPRNINVANNGDEKKDPKLIVPKGSDPKAVWDKALAFALDRGVEEPGVIIAATDYLAQHGKFEYTAGFLKENLRRGLVVRPWVYKSLAIALRQSGGSTEEIERAEVSAADLESLDARGYLLAARALAEDRNYERALAFCKQAADLEPGTPHAYADAARYAEMADDARALQWAAGKLLAQDWPVRNAEVQEIAVQKVEALARRLGKAGGDRLKKAVDEQKRRDLVVKLLWQGEADLDLKVQEPSGSFCSPLSRQTVGGGTLLASSPSNPNGETYLAAQAFPGEYRITVEKVWGKPLGNKVQVRIIKHQGTADETEQVVTLKMVSNISEPITVKLDRGRRTDAAHVPPSAQLDMDSPSTSPASDGDAVLSKLRALADPEVTGVERGRQQGGVVTPGRASARPVRITPRSNEKDRTLYQMRVAPFLANSIDVTAQAVISADRRSVRLSFNVVGSIARPAQPPAVISPVFPGGIPPGGFRGP